MIVALSFSARGYECKMVRQDDLTRMSYEHGGVMYKVVFVRAKDGEAKSTDDDYAFITGYRAKCLSEYLDTFDPKDEMPEES